MADAELTDPGRGELTAIAEDDWLYVVDVSDTTAGADGTGKRIKRSNLFKTYPVVEVAAAGSTETIVDGSRDQIHSVTLTADCTLTFPTAAEGASFLLALTQDTTGSWDVVWPSNIGWVDGVEPTMSLGMEVTDLFRFFCVDGTNWIGETRARRISLVPPPQIVQYKPGGAFGGTTVTTTTVIMGDTPVTGNMLFAFMRSVGTREGTPVTPSGASVAWTEQYDTGSSVDGGNNQCWSRVVESGETNSYQFDWDGTAEFNSVIVVEVSGVGSVDEIATSVSGNSTAPSGTNTNRPNLIFLHATSDSGASGGSLLDFGPDWVTLFRRFPNFHANGVAYRYEFALTWPTGNAILNMTATNIPRGLISLSTT